MNNNHRVRESCLICEGTGKNGKESCTYCSGSGHVFSRTAESQFMQMTGDCKMPMKLVSGPFDSPDGSLRAGLNITRQFTNG